MHDPEKLNRTASLTLGLTAASALYSCCGRSGEAARKCRILELCGVET
jgi:hypothetical protein